MAKQESESGENQSSKRSVVSFQVDEKQKERYQNYADEAGFRNMSDFIRTSLEKEIKRKHDQTNGEVPNQIVQQMGEVLESMDNIQEHIHKLDNRIGSIENEVKRDPQVQELASEVFGVLPTKDEIIDWAKGNIHPDQPKHQANPVCFSGTIESIARSLDVEKYEAEQAIEHLKRNTGQVNSLTLNDTIPYYDHPDNASADLDGEKTRYYKLE